MSGRWMLVLMGDVQSRDKNHTSYLNREIKNFLIKYKVEGNSKGKKKTNITEVPIVGKAATPGDGEEKEKGWK